MISSVNWFYPKGDYKNISVKIRYNSKHYRCDVQARGSGATVFLKEKAFLPTPGQLAVLYDGDRVMAGGWIEKEKRWGEQ